MSLLPAFNSPDEAAVQAFLAGADILLMPENLDAAIYGLKKAYSDGLITAARLNESVERILRIKQKRGLFSDISREDPEKVLGCREHRELAEIITKYSK